MRWLAYTGLGLEMGLTVGVLMGVGYYLDQRWSTQPWLLLAGAGLGMLGAASLLIKIVKKL